MVHLLGGYFVVQGASQLDEGGTTLLPETVWSLSDCVSYLYPGLWAHAQGPDDAAERELVSEVLQLDPARLSLIQGRMEDMVQRGELLWPNVFVAPDAASRFAGDALGQLVDLRLLSGALPRDLAEVFIEEAGRGAGDDSYAVLECLRESAAQGREPEEEGEFVGFEILGWDDGGFHSHICNQLADDFANVGIALNVHGLIDSEDDARRAAELAAGELDADPALWLPWRIAVHPLEFDD